MTWQVYLVHCEVSLLELSMSRPCILFVLFSLKTFASTKGDPLGWQRAGYMRGIGGKNYFLRLI